MNLEFLAHKWGLIDHAKYLYRFEQQNQKDPALPKDAYVQCYFDIKTLKLAY